MAPTYTRAPLSPTHCPLQQYTACAHGDIPGLHCCLSQVVWPHVLMSANNLLRPTFLRQESPTSDGRERCTSYGIPVYICHCCRPYGEHAFEKISARPEPSFRNAETRDIKILRVDNAHLPRRGALEPGERNQTKPDLRHVALLRLQQKRRNIHKYKKIRRRTYPTAVDCCLPPPPFCEHPGSRQKTSPRDIRKETKKKNLDCRIFSFFISPSPSLGCCYLLSPKTKFYLPLAAVPYLFLSLFLPPGLPPSMSLPPLLRPQFFPSPTGFCLSLPTLPIK